MPTTKILILAANPKDTQKLRLDEEVRDIQESLKLSKQRDQFEVISVHAVRIKDLRRSLLDHEPQILHFSGHGTTNGLALENNSGQTQLVSATSLANLFELFPDVQCVLLNACYSLNQAQAIAQHIPHVIGMSAKIGDEAAKQFSMGFYDGIGNGRTYHQAFKLGKSALDLENLPDTAIPQFITGQTTQTETVGIDKFDSEPLLKAELGAGRTAVRPYDEPLPHSKSFDLPDGTMDPDSPLYIERDCDSQALETIRKQGKTLSIKGPRQVGKSSLLNRIAHTATEHGKQVAFIDFQLFSQTQLQNEDEFYKEFCRTITYELDAEDQTEKYWEITISNKQRCDRYIGIHLLKQLNQPLVLAMDEVDVIFNTPFRDDFFGMLRAWHNKRGRPPFLWKKLDIVVVTSTEPYELIADLNQSPFNVGTILTLKDFTPEQTHQLNQKYGSPLTDSEEAQLMDLVHGHPFLIQRALHWVASGKTTASDLFANAISDNEPFGSHLKHHLHRLQNRPDQIQSLQEIFQKHQCSNRSIYHLLQGAGLVREETHNCIVPRNRLYEEYLRPRLQT